MDRIKRQITKRLRDLLPEDRKHYRLDELRTFGFPDFVKQRIRVELERKLSESVRMPETEWADMEAEAIQSLWVRFEHAVRQEAYLPAVSAPSVINIVVSDVLNILVLPREKLSEVIYGDDAELSYDQLIERLETVVVYRHFADLIPRYMQKKDVQKLSKERCAAIVERADERLTARYTPLNWAQMLEPLFQLSDQEIDPELLTLFFEDKNKPRLAKLFNSIHTAVNRKEFIEILSSPDSLDLDDQQEKEDGIPVSKAPENKETDDQPEVKKKQPEQSSDSSSVEQKTTRVDVSSGEDPIVGAFHKFRENLREKEMQGKDAADNGDSHNGTSLNDTFLNQNEDENRSDASADEDIVSPEEQSEVQNGSSGAQKKNRSESETAEAEDTGEQFADDGSEVIESVFGQMNADEETPMWKRFLSSEELASLEEEESSDTLEDALSPVKEKESPEDKKLDLQKELKNDQSFFTEELFRGSEEAYDKALKEIANSDDWRSASRYISENVFKRNLVDMYSEAAVEFTDRLHAYFMKKSKS